MAEIDPGLHGGERGEGIGHRRPALGASSGSSVLHNGGEAGHAALRGGSHDLALRLLVADPTCLEEGLEVLDTRLPLDESTPVDLLARDRLGYPVVVLFCDEDPGAALARVATVAAGWQRAHPLVGRLFAARGLHASLRPRFVLVSRRFPDAMTNMLDLLGGAEVRAVECRVVRAADGKPLLDLLPFARRTPGARAAAAGVGDEDAPFAPAAPATRARPAPAERVAFVDAVTKDPLERELFLRAWESLADLSAKVSETRGDGRVDFRVGDRPLAALRLEPHGVSVSIGEGGQPAVPIVDEAGLHGALNLVFSHYFSELAADHG